MTALETLLKKLEEKANSAQPVAIHAHETGIFTIQENTVVTDKETIKKLIAVIRAQQEALNIYANVAFSGPAWVIPAGTEIKADNGAIFFTGKSPYFEPGDLGKIAKATLEDCEKIVRGE